MSTDADSIVKVVTSLAAVDQKAWDAVANPDRGRFNPFVTYDFLKSLEDARCVGPRTGWVPRHLILEDSSGGIAAAAPAYGKTHSQGEYVFDHGWADAFERAGGRYYPKLQIAVPFTPVPGPRLLVRQGEQSSQNEQMLAAAAIALAEQSNLSSIHITFLDKAASERLSSLGFLIRTGQQFHWQNAGFGAFDDFLASLSSRKRKGVRKERAGSMSEGINIEWFEGQDITEAHWDAMYEFYIETGSRKWGQPYLNREFFSHLGTRMAAHCLLIMATRGGKYIAGALHVRGGDCLYGRYWGACEHHPFLHFELCYYQAIDYAIRHKLVRVEAGAQGEHKLARGYLPVETYSAHWIADPHLERAVARFLAEEHAAVKEANLILSELGPYRKA